MPSPSPYEHTLLSSLNDAARRIIQSAIAIVDIAADELLFESGQPLDRIWFIQSGLISMVTVLQDGREVDGLVVGHGGALGLPASLGSHRAISRAHVVVAGEAWSLPGAACRQAMAVDEAFSHRLMTYYEAVFAAVVQITACNSAHTLRQRFCRFLLTCRGQLKSDTIPLRQEFVSQMLGVNRTSITPISRALQVEGTITVRHGRIHIRNLSLLQSCACECHAVISARFPLPG